MGFTDSTVDSLEKGKTPWEKKNKLLAGSETSGRAAEGGSLPQITQRCSVCRLYATRLGNGTQLLLRAKSMP